MAQAAHRLANDPEAPLLTPALALIAALSALPDVLGDDLDAVVQDEPALREAGRSTGRSPHAPPCEEDTGWVGDDDLRDPAPCDDDPSGAWLVGPPPPGRDGADAD